MLHVHGNGIPNGHENPMGMGIKQRIGNGNGGMGNHLTGNLNYLHSHENLFPRVLCCGKLVSSISRATCQMCRVYRLPMSNVFWTTCASLYIPLVRQTSIFPT